MVRGRPGCAAVLQQHVVDQGVGHDCEVRSLARRVEIGEGGISAGQARAFSGTMPNPSTAPGELRSSWTGIPSSSQAAATAALHRFRPSR